MTFYNTFANYLGDDVTAEFAVPFSYSSQNEVVVTRQGGPVSYTFINPALIQIDAPLATGDALKVERRTDLSTKKVVYANGSPSTAGMLNTSFDQLLQGLQEASDTSGSQFGITTDGNWDGLNRRMTNVSDPVNAQDVVTKNYIETVFTGPAATPAEIKTKYESNADTNAFTDAEKAKLDSFLYAKDYGVVAGDTSTDYRSALETAMAAAVSAGKVLYGVPGVVTLKSQLTIPTGLRYFGNNMTLLFDAADTVASPQVLAAGSVGTIKPITADASKGASSIQITGHSLSVGDWLFFYSSINAMSLAAGELRLGDRADSALDANAEYFGEFHRVFEVTDADNVTIRGVLQYNYPTGYGVGVAAIAGGGTGYVAGDVLTVSGGTGTAATITVKTVSGGVITDATVTTQGAYSVVPSNPVSVTGGSGSGATFTLSTNQCGVYKVTPWEGELNGLIVDHDNYNTSVRPLRANWALGDFDIEIKNSLGSVNFQSCLPGTKVKFKSRGNIAVAEATNNIHLQITDGTEGEFEIDCENGGQLVDFTYTSSYAYSSPPGNCRIWGRTNNSHAQSITTHPGCGQIMIGPLVATNCESAVYIRSPRAIITNILHTGTGSADGAAVYLGETGYTHGSVINNVITRNVKYGLLVGGGGNTLYRRDLDIDNFNVTDALIGFRFGSTESTAAGFHGIKGRNLKASNCSESGMSIYGGNTGIDLEFDLRGPFTNAAIATDTTETDQARLVGTVYDGGAAIPVIGGAGSLGKNCYVDIRRIGDNDIPSINTEEIQTPWRCLQSRTSVFTYTGSTSEQTVDANFFYFPSGTLYKGAITEMIIEGNFTGSAGTKTFKLNCGGSLVNSLPIDAAANSIFRIVFRTVWDSDTTQRAFQYAEADNHTNDNPGMASRSIDATGGAWYQLYTTLGSAADTVNIRSIVLHARYV